MLDHGVGVETDSTVQPKIITEGHQACPCTNLISDRLHDGVRMGAAKRAQHSRHPNQHFKMFLHNCHQITHYADTIIHRILKVYAYIYIYIYIYRAFFSQSTPQLSSGTSFYDNK
jgi:hypothetical protein